MLDNAAADPPTWLLVAGHYPMFSSGDHGDTAELKSYLLPLLQRYKVCPLTCKYPLTVTWTSVNAVFH